MKKIGIVTEINKDEALVMIAKSESCGTNCGCGAFTRINGKIRDKEHNYIKVKNIINAQVGDPVNIEFKTSKMLNSTLLLYFIPLLMLILGIFIGTYFQGNNQNELISFLSGIISMFISYIILSLIYKSKKSKYSELITISEFRGF